MLAVSAVDDDADTRVFWGVLLHDIGKASTTTFTRGRWRSFGHAAAGAAVIPAILARVDFPELGADVAWLIRHHDFHFSWQLRADGRVTKQQRKFMEHQLFPLLLEVCAADAAGSEGVSVKERKIKLLAEIYAEDVAGEKPPMASEDEDGSS